MEYITEMKCGTNLAFLLNDYRNFLPTEYKVLQSQTEGCFIKCMKMLYNGKIQLYYLTKNLKPFSALLPSLDAESFIKIVTNLFMDIIEVKQNGFLSCRNIDAAFNHIYVDSTTYKVYLVYLPMNREAYVDESYFETEIRTGLIKLISEQPELASIKTKQLANDLANGTLRVEDIYNRAKGGKDFQKDIGNETEYSEVVQTLRLIALNTPNRFEIRVDKQEFILGKKKDACDGIIGFNPMISRVHCKILKKGSDFSIMDLQSANGTYVNKMRLQPNQEYPIKNGDIIRLANSDFQVSIG